MGGEGNNKMMDFLDHEFTAAQMARLLTNSIDNDLAEAKAKSNALVKGFNDQAGQSTFMVNELNEVLAERFRQMNEQQKDIRAAVMKIAEVISGKMQAGEDLYSTIMNNVMSRIITSTDFNDAIKKLVLDVMAAETGVVVTDLTAMVVGMVADIKTILAYITTNLPAKTA